MKKLLIFILLLTACKKPISRLRLIKITHPCVVGKKDLEVERPYVTVFIHGTVLTPSWLAHDFFYSIPGIHHSNEYDKKYRLSVITDILCSHSDGLFTPNYFYHFGWSGKLSFTAREEAAVVLVKELTALVTQCEKEYGQKPHLTLITHSHGGNVVLNMAKSDHHLEIDRLILLACPVQEETKNFIKNKMFKKVYSFYSGIDAIQVLDPQGVQKKSNKTPLFSERLFPSCPHLKQMKLRINGHGILHVDFLRRKFLSNLPLYIKKVEELDQDSSLVLISYWDKKSSNR